MDYYRFCLLFYVIFCNAWICALPVASNCCAYSIIRKALMMKLGIDFSL
jgi:hypothetical protein